MSRWDYLVWVVPLILVVAVVVKAQSPALNDQEKLRVENLSLKVQVANLQRQLSDAQVAVGNCAAQLGPLRSDADTTTLKGALAALKAEIERAHPGMDWDPVSGELKEKSRATSGGPLGEPQQLPGRSGR